jgi:hypothetical protein
MEQQEIVDYLHIVNEELGKLNYKGEICSL